MPWKVETVMSRRRELVTLAQLDGADMSELCRRNGISRKTGYKRGSTARVVRHAGQGLERGDGDHGGGHGKRTLHRFGGAIGSDALVVA
jgi:hypothetical protein